VQNILYGGHVQHNRVESSQSIKKLAKDKKYIGGDIAGFTGILHTWGRQMQFHPHIHYIVPGAVPLTKMTPVGAVPSSIFIFR
jgi:hypothetical protein